jgi:prepilin-type N-terminal cleavage/methylation domain-containing protein
MKKEKGVSMIELVVVMIILVMIAAFAISSGLDTVDQAKITEVYAEMRSIEESINGINTLKVTNADPDTFDLSPYHNGVLTAENINAYTDEELPSVIKTGMIASGNTYYSLIGIVSEESYNDAVGKALGIGNIKRNYIISFDSSEVILIGGAQTSGGRVYTLDQVEEYIENGETT